MPLSPIHPAAPRPLLPRTRARGGRVGAAAAGLCAALALPAGGALAVPAAPGGPADVRSQIAGRSADLAALSRKIEGTVEDYNSARIALAAAQRAAAKAKANAERAGRDYLAKRALLSGYAASAYRSGDGGSIAAMLTSTPAEYLDRLSTLDAVAHRQTEIVTAVATARQQYAAQVGAAEAAARTALRVTQGIAATRSAIEGQIATQRNTLAGLLAERDRLRALAARQQAAQDAEAAAATRAKARQIDRATANLGHSQSSDRPASRTEPAARPAPPASGRGGAAVAAAYTVLGRPYVYGAAGPGSFDCSGLTMWAWARAGVSLPHSSRSQYGVGTRVSKSALQPGDLLFFYSPISHVGMYIGGGRMIAAPQTGDVVKISTPQWGSYVGAVRPG